jgi:hypothetical protein
MEFMRQRRETRILKDKALASLKRAIACFNSFDDDGRATAVLVQLQHAFEMLIKAGLTENGVKVFDKRFGRSFGFDKCINLATVTKPLSLSEHEAGTLRAIDALRDDAQHWFAEMSEGLLYAHVRAGVTLFDDLLHRSFGERLADSLPHRVLPISSEPPKDIQLLIDQEYEQIKDLLRPSRRRGPEARGRIRSLLALESHRTPDALVTKQDVDRVERAIKAGAERSKVFPQLGEIASVVEGEGLSVTVRFVKAGGLPVTFVASESDTDAAAIREVDLQKKYHWAPFPLASKVGLSPPRATALRRYLRIDDDPDCTYTFVFGKQRHTRYSDNALRKMQAAIDEVDIDEVWRTHRPAVTVSAP